MKAMLSALVAGLFLIGTASAFAAEPVNSGQGQVVADQDSGGGQDSGSQSAGQKKSDDD